MARMNRRAALRQTVAGVAAVGASAGMAQRGESRGAPAASARPGKYLILSCDGGGYRGALTARIIQQLQAECPFLERIHLFAGTSTGSFLALGLAKGVRIDELVRLYEEKGAQIFDKPTPDKPAKPASRWRDKLHLPDFDLSGHLGFGLKDCLHPKYPAEGLRKALVEMFGAGSTFANLPPGKAALVTTLRLATRDDSDHPREKQGWAPLVLHNVEVGGEALGTKVEDGPTPTTTLVDAALCSSAAPLYFPPHEHPEFGYCVDGGLFANCPAGVALAVALRAGNDRDMIRILSIGTGAQVNRLPIPSRLPFDEATDYGALAWLAPVARNNNQTPPFPLVSALFDASSASHSYLCKQILGDRYQRVQVVLDEPIALDEATPESARLIRKAADKLFASPDWQETKKWLGEAVA